MISRLSKPALSLTTALWLCHAAPVLAQDAAAPQADQNTDVSPGDIVVTARRSDERLQDVPISITVFDQEQLSQRNVVTASDIATYTPSLSSNSRFGSDNSSFAIRGFTQEVGTSPSVGVYFADVVAPRGGLATTSGDGAGAGAFFDLQNVQVLKGPQGTLFGRNTTGGAVLLVPHKPTSKLEGYVELSGGNYDMRRFQAVLNVPFSDSIRLRLGVDDNSRDGYLKNRSGIGPSDFADVDYTAARASLSIDVTPDIENYTVGSYSLTDNNGSLPRVFACNPASFPLGQAACAQVARQANQGYYDVENNLPTAANRTQQWQVINTTTWLASDTLTIKNIVSYAEFKQKSEAAVFGENLFVPAAVNIPGVPFPIPTGALAGSPINFVSSNPFPGKNSAAQSTFTEELQFQGRAFDDRLSWQAGGYYESSKPMGISGAFSPQLLSCTNPDTLQCFDPFGMLLTGLGRAQNPAAPQVFVGSIGSRLAATEFRNIAAYAQATYNFTDQLSFTGGFRYTWDRTTSRGQQVSYQFVAPGVAPLTRCSNTLVFGIKTNVTEADCEVRFKQKSSAPTWLVDLDYKPNEDILLYAKWARGYRQGNANVFAPGFEIYGPESVDTYEIGSKTTFRGTVRGTFNIAAFYNDFSNQQLQGNAVAALGSGVAVTNATFNAGKSRIWGIEIDTSVMPFDGFTLNASYAYLNTKVISITAPAIPVGSPFTRVDLTANQGDELSLSPHNKASISGNYQLPFPSEVGEVTIGATFTHTDKQVATAASPFGVLPATDLLNLNLSWNSIAGKPIDLSLFATNVTKEKYPVYIAGAFSSVGFESRINGEPRMYGARLRVRFGD